jgi:DNA-directed RNA polymerase subunit E'/Rpb7
MVRKVKKIQSSRKNNLMKNDEIKIKIIKNQKKKSESTRINSTNPPHGT